MAGSSGRGKQSFREFTKAANQLKRFIEAAIKQGNQYTIEEVEAWYDAIIEEYSEHLRTNDIPNEELWLSRAEDTKSAQLDYLINRYPALLLFEQEADNEDEDGDNEGSGDNEDNVSLMGIPIVTDDECRDNGGQPRGQVLLTYDELIEYLSPIPQPAIKGLIPVFGENGTVIGYRLCAGDT